MPYRDELAALRERLAAVESELVRAREARANLAAAAERERALSRESDALRARLDDARRRLPTVPTIHIASPCTEDWDAMQGDERVRFCGKCRKEVFNLSAMDDEAAARFVSERSGKACARMYVRHDGTVITSDCAVGMKSRLLRYAGRSAVGALAVSAAIMAGLRAERAASRDGLPQVRESRVLPEQLGLRPIRALPEHQWAMGLASVDEGDVVRVQGQIERAGPLLATPDALRAQPRCGFSRLCPPRARTPNK